MESIKLSFTTDRHTITIRPSTSVPSSVFIGESPSVAIGNHQHQSSATININHRQPPAPVIGMDPSSLPDSAISCRFLIGTNLHRQLLCELSHHISVCQSTPHQLQIHVQRYVSKNGVNTCPPISEYKIINAPKFSSIMLPFRNYSFP